MPNVNQCRLHLLHSFDHWNKGFYKIQLWFRKLSILVITYTLERFGVGWFQDWSACLGTCSVRGTAWYSRDVCVAFLWERRTLRWDGEGRGSGLTVSSHSVVEEIILTGFPSQLQMPVDWSIDLIWNYLGASSSDLWRLGKYTFLEASSPLSFPPYRYYEEIFLNPGEEIHKSFKWFFFFCARHFLVPRLQECTKNQSPCPCRPYVLWEGSQATNP